MALGTELAAHVTAVLAAVATAMGTKTDVLIVKDRITHNLTDAIVREVVVAVAARNLSDVPRADEL